MKGAPLEDVADLLGHKSLWMTRRVRAFGSQQADTSPKDASTDGSQVVVQ